MNVTVIGGGSWGTALAQLLAEKGYQVPLLVRDPKQAEAINSTRENAKYLPNVPLHKNITATADPNAALSGSRHIVFSVPCQVFRSTLKKLEPLIEEDTVIICTNKGLELDTGKTVSEVVTEELGHKKPVFAMLSGPSFAAEVVRGMPTAVVLGCSDARCGKDLREMFSNENFRAYSSTDVLGVELGGAFKNVIAIAAGMSDGLKFGANARAALITRGLAEMSRLGVAMGAKAETFMGLSGMGDLVLTCTGDLSRNRQVGLKLGQGKTMAEILEEMQQVAEGVKTTTAVHQLAQRLNVELPITATMHAIIHDGKNPHDAWRELMKRELREE
ncbi:NAD(P)H-dependent glycerol-3-phosphate dehydrogenase [Halodesulfovibrio marinisediminis]|uniref:Glycerol-3-phosphate dehydrogenase [NAD(P)+] n=1 Tax=Halodesulfovibrio marinisediminis DSM 17456 TaxID=1121457 RepID=A0A1N6F3F3_9BACT|nr:NAD(P)H-dependent glycerol-3-phosphate dehydrogenase [Halodesulfovibrio marinisediminis]SIN89769.1 glycerol 3-phosphate dehydrogenase (NAD(P)+) [Halodesulfovibrio marinisediminis DSM 17456]